MAIDTETTGISFFDTPFLATVAWEENGEIKSKALEIDEANNEVVRSEREALGKILSDSSTWIFHNAKFDLQKLILVGIIKREEVTPERIEDTEACAHLLDEHQKKGLKALAKNLLGEETDEAEAIRAARRKHKLRKADGYHLLPRDVVIPYALRDAEYTLRLWLLLKQQIERVPELSELYQREMALTLALLDIEARGIGVDVEYAKRTAKEYNTRILAQRMLIRDLTGKEDFNPNSPKQIQEAFAELEIELDSTDKAHLKNLDHPLAKAILDLRTLSKMHGTYLKPLIEEQQDGIIHPWFRQHKPVTGRLASGGVEDA